MSPSLKLMVVTTSRADYGLLSPLLQRLGKDPHFEVLLVATGTHLSPLHGYTLKQIQEEWDGELTTVDMTMSNDSEQALCNAVSVGVQGFSRVLMDEKPDAVILLGDRYELFSIAPAAVIHKIPIIHIHGGEATFGAIDEAIRHAVTKMAAIHFPTIPAYARRIIQMGENPAHVFAVGALGVDNIHQIETYSVEAFSKLTGVQFVTEKVALMTYHPVTLEGYKEAAQQAKNLMDALLDTDLTVLVTMPNADTGGVQVYETIQGYLNHYPQKFRLMKSLGQKGYLSAMRYARLMVGNSSSGILESASFQLPVVNIGDRQAGRFAPENVIHCGYDTASIKAAIQDACSDAFRAAIAGLVNPYGDGKAAERIAETLKTIDFRDKTLLLKKGFFDMPAEVIDGAVEPLHLAHA